jgi:hypothetical protein
VRALESVVSSSDETILPAPSGKALRRAVLKPSSLSPELVLEMGVAESISSSEISTRLHFAEKGMLRRGFLLR